jgi:choline dehydrogenase
MTRFAVRGSPADYDEWAALGNEGWTFDDVLPYFNRLEADEEFGGEQWHGDAGPIPVTRYPELERAEASEAALAALASAGFPAVPDHNRPGAVGAGPMPMSSRDGIRVTTADAYLPAGVTAPNLTIRPDTQIGQIVFEHDRAVGVRDLDGAVIEAGRVVLCAGVYGSPSLLMRSGVGPPDELGSLGIPVVAALPGVGENLADHPGVDIELGYRSPGRLAPLLHTIATFHSATPAGAAPDLMLWISEPTGPEELWIDIVLMKPEARGRVRLRSPDPGDPPRIELPAASEPSDLSRLAEGYRRAWEVAHHPRLRALCSEPPVPAIEIANDLTSVARQNAFSVPHVVGTCAMGTSPDQGAVVDTEGSVHGTAGLSVVDASIIPAPSSGFPHLATIMLAERLAERIAVKL